MIHTPKDLKQIVALKKRAKGILKKEIDLATLFSNMIVDVNVCSRCTSASVEVFSAGHPVTGIFIRRFHILNGQRMMRGMPMSDKIEFIRGIENEQNSLTSCLDSAMEPVLTPQEN